MIKVVDTLKVSMSENETKYSLSVYLSRGSKFELRNMI